MFLLLLSTVAVVVARRGRRRRRRSRDYNNDYNLFTLASEKNRVARSTHGGRISSTGESECRRNDFLCNFSHAGFDVGRVVFFPFSFEMGGGENVGVVFLMEMRMGFCLERRGREGEDELVCGFSFSFSFLFFAFGWDFGSPFPLP